MLKLLIYFALTWSIHLQRMFSMASEIPSSDFEQIIKSKSFIDKTLLIRDFFLFHAKEGTFVVLTYPRKFGKSTNMNMLRRFVEIDFYRDTGKLKIENESFNHLIFKNKTLRLKIRPFAEMYDKHFQKYPVVHLDLFGIVGKNPDDTFKGLQRALYNCFVPYSWLWRFLREKYAVPGKGTYYSNVTASQKHDFEVGTRIIRKESDKLDVKVALQVLARTLKNHFKKKVFFFMDNFDAMLIDGITSQSNRTKILDVNSLMISLLQDFIKKDFAQDNIAYGFLTGISDVPVETFYSKFDHVKNYSFLQEHYFTPYYGFVESEMATLYRRYDVPKTEQQQIANYYDGYRISSYFPHIYNTYSIVNLFADDKRTLANYWARTGRITHFYGFLRYGMIRKSISHLLFANGTLNKLIHPMPDPEQVLMYLKSLFSMQNCKSRTWGRKRTAGIDCDLVLFNYFFKVLWENGYLTTTDKQDFYRIPNTEIYEDFEYLFIFYYGVEKDFPEIAKSLNSSFIGA